MGDIATKLTYLNTTKGLIKDTINLTGAGITNDTFRSYANKLKLGLINALNDNGDTIYSNLEKVSGKGSNLSLTPTYEAPMRNREIYGDTLQDGTPTPSSPVPIQSVTGLQNVEVCGKNLFEPVLTIDGTNINLTNCTANKDNDVLSFTATAKDWRFGDLCATGQSYQKTYGVLIEVNEGETYSFTFSNTNITKNYITFYNANKISLGYVYKDTNSFTYTMPSDTKYISLRIGIGQATVVGETYTTTIQIEKGQATTYEPYNGNTYEVNLGNIELNKIGDYQDSIKKSTGKNLFDKDNANIINGNLADGGTLSSTNNARTLYIPCKNNTTYTITKLQAVYFRVAQFTNVPQIGDSYISRTKDDLANSITFTTTTGNYLAVTYWYNTSTYTEQQILDSIMINEGSTALPYEPYGKVWYITKNIGKVVLNGSEANWSKSGNTTFDRFILGTNIHGIVSQGGYSNYFKVVNINIASNLYEMSNNGNSQLVFNYSTYGTTDLSTFKNWLSSNNVEVLYQLETPKYEVITNTELIEDLESLYNAKSKNGTTNIVITSQDLAMIMNVSVIKGDA